MIRKIKNFIADITPKIKCFFLGHKYDYQMGNWKGGHYEDIYLTCNRCGRNFTKVALSEIKGNLDV